MTFTAGESIKGKRRGLMKQGLEHKNLSDGCVREKEPTERAHSELREK